jgi:hypothetical protein
VAEENAEPSSAETEGSETDTSTSTSPSGTSTAPPPSTSSGYDSYYYDTDYYDTDYGYDPECEGDEDCDLGTCISPGENWAYCEPLPIPTPCGDVPELETAWVRQGKGAGRAIGMVASDRVVLLDAVVEEVPVPVSVATTDADAVPESVPVELQDGESVIGAAGGDLDGDGDIDLILSVQDDARLRAVVLLAGDEGVFAEAASVTFGEPGEPALLRRYEDGTADLLARLDSGQLSEAVGLGDGTFAEPAPATWTMGSVASLATGPLDGGLNEDIAVIETVDDFGVIDVQLDAGLLPVGASGSLGRSLHIDAVGGRMITLDEAPEGTSVQSVELAAFAESESFLVPADDTPLAGSTVTDLDGDGRSDAVLLLDGGGLNVLFGVSTQSACLQPIEIEGSFASLHRAGSGSGSGVVLSGPQGVLVIRGAAEAKR